jgi:signal peptidase I
MIFDFSFILTVATLVTGVIWGLDAWLWKPQRLQRAAAKGVTPENVREPVIVEYARSFFPVILIVLVIRSFLFEPFRIPSDSMMPTLLDGDFIFVNKFAYGLRLPVINSKIVSIGEPKRGDVIVFRLPSDPSVNYIKRLVGLPGDHITVRDRQVFVNGKPMQVQLDGRYRGPRNTGAQADAQQGEEDLDGVKHRILYIPERDSRDYDHVVPENHYFFMGDNRDNSRDSRFEEVGLVPEGNLVGKAVRIWLNWDLPDAPIWNRIGDAIK